MLLHGWERHQTQFHALGLALISAGYSVIIIQPPGHRGVKGERSSPAHFARALTAVIEDIGPPQLVVGHSMGGLAALLAGNQGASISCLATVGAPSDMATKIKEIANRLRLLPRACDFMNQAIEGFANLPVSQTSVACFSSSFCDGLLIMHDETDRQVAPSNVDVISSKWPSAETFTTRNLGHNRILQSVNVHDEILKLACRNL
jgi:pimeloyl-ACP methyl ester carboxylesterase